MSPLLKAVGIGIAVFVASLLLLYGIARTMKRPFLPQFPRAPLTSPTPITPIFPAL